MTERLKPILVGPKATIQQAMVAIDRGAYEIALVVDAERRLLGAVTDGDVRRALLAGRALTDPVIEHASRSPYTVGPEAGRAEVLDLMNARTIAQVPVVDGDGVLVGLHVMRELVGREELDNTAVILAGGRGTRLQDVTLGVPKPMVPVAGRPILERIVLHLVGAGIRKIIISVGYMAEVIEGHFGDGSKFGCRISYVREDPDSPLGTGGPLRLVGELPDPPTKPLLLMNGDLVTDVPVPDLLRYHEEHGPVVTMTYWHHHHEVPYGVLDLDPSGNVAGLVEKPLESWPINAGVYVIEPELLMRAPAGVEFPMTDLIIECLERGEPVSAFQIDGEWHDIGTPDQLWRARGEP